MNQELFWDEHMILKSFTDGLLSSGCINLTEDRMIPLAGTVDFGGLEMVDDETRNWSFLKVPSLKKQNPDTRDLILAKAGRILNEEKRVEFLRQFSVRGLLNAYDSGKIHLSLEAQCRVRDWCCWVMIQAELFRNPESGDLIAYLYSRDINKQKKNEQIMNVILDRSADYVAIINIRTKKVVFQYLSDEILKAAPHWKYKSEIDFEKDMYQALSAFLQEDEARLVQSRTSLACILKELEEKPVYTATFVMHLPDSMLRKQVQYYWIDEFREEILAVQTDITVAYEKERQNERIRREAVTDPLTGLPNRRGLRSELDQIEARCKKTGSPLTVAMGDIDFFKKINDSYGHEAGDAALVRVAGMMLAFMDGRGIVSRTGGEEFFFAFPGIHLAEAKALLEGFREKISRELIPFDSSEIRITMTFGAAAFDQKGTLHDAVQAADMKLYYGKEHGRNQVQG